MVMAGWTLLTAAAGWYAMSGTEAEANPSGGTAALAGSSTALARTVGPAARTVSPVGTPGAFTPTVTAPRGTPSTGSPTTTASTPGTGSTTPSATETATATVPAVPTRPAATATARPYPVPQYAQSAGIDGATSDVAGGSLLRTDRIFNLYKGVVVLDPGHGRGDPGAVHTLADGTPDVLEAGSNLRNAHLIREELVRMGYDVYLTREGPGRGPEGPLAEQFISSDLIWRVQLAAAVDADVFLALHGNGASVTSISGPETWYCGKHEQGSANQRLAAVVQQAMMAALHEYGYFPPDRGIMEDAERHHSGDFCQFVVTRESVVPSALLEFLFLSNDDDARVLADDRSHIVLAKHVALAIDQFLTQPPP